MADHEAGGFMINGPHGEIYRNKGQKVDAGWTSDSHTGQDTLVWSQGPYSEYLGRALDNTDLFYVVSALTTTSTSTMSSGLRCLAAPGMTT